MSSSPTVGIVGGGILGLTAAYRLAQAGVQVTLFERAADLGGLVGSFDFDGKPVDRFYHVILPTDDRVRRLADELGLGERFRFRPTKVGFYSRGRLFSLTSPLELVTFPLLRPIDRVRLGVFIAQCQLKDRRGELDELPLVSWLERTCGRRVTERLWKPLLDSKFDGCYDDLPATYIWSRSRRMSTTRDRRGREVMGWLEGGYQTLVDALVRRIVELGGEVRAGTPVDRIAAAGDRIVGLVVNRSFRAFDLVLCTLPPAQTRTILDPRPLQRLPPDHLRYLGVVCVILRTRRSISPYYHLNITDRSIPLTTVVETTHVVDPDHVGGHLVYVSKYVDPSSPYLSVPTEDVEAEFLGYLRTMFPSLGDDDIVGRAVQRARVVEPVHPLGGARLLPEMFPVRGLAHASTGHVYPDILSGQAVTGVAEEVVAGILSRLPATRRAAA